MDLTHNLEFVARHLDVMLLFLAAVFTPISQLLGWLASKAEKGELRLSARGRQALASLCAFVAWVLRLINGNRR